MKLELLVKVAGGVAVAAVSTVAWAKNAYHNLAQKHASSLDVDAYIGQPPTNMEALQCVMMNRYTRITRKLNSKPYKILAEDSKHQDGLKVTRRATEDETPTDTSGGSGKKPPLVIGTIRMGFGHHRIAHGVSSWGLDAVDGGDRDVYFHDILNINSDEGTLIDAGETLYSMGSQMATEGPSFVEDMWGGATGSGGANALRTQCHVAVLLNSLMTGLDRNSPVISTHPLVGAIAVAAGFKNVVNLVVDNHAQWFVVVPGALNLVQGPSAYRELLKLGIPENELELVGHWIPKFLVDDIPDAVQRRINRVENQKPIRLLIPVGGAGAQKTLLKNLIKACAPLVKAGKVQLFLNAADHEHIQKGFKNQLKNSGLDYELISDIDGMHNFRDNLLSSEANEPNKGVTLFSFKHHYPAVTATDALMQVSDVLVCKPSEMAFYCIPKLMIRRVGDHEQKSAYRTAELGDGTLEARTIDDTMNDVKQFLSNPSDLITMNKAIEKNNYIGIYDGSKIAVERALQRAAEMGQ